MALWLLLSQPAHACSVPVFRWALERWPADNYELVLRQAGPDADRFQQAAVALKANLTVQAPGAADGAEFSLLYPGPTHHNNQALSGDLTQLAPESLLDSPARQEIARRILDGHSGVWLLLSSGDAAKDAACQKLFNEQLVRANKTLHLPDMADDPVLQAPGAPDVSNLRVEFSLITVRRDDPAERVLVEMLLGIEPDLRDYREPLAFPVYGRGRVLYALVGSGINADTIHKACAFLVGRCACEIKAENPGTDLLMAADWETRIPGGRVIGNVQLPPLPGAAFSPADVAAPTEPAPDSDSGNIALLAGLAIAGAVALVGAASLMVMRRAR